MSQDYIRMNRTLHFGIVLFIGKQKAEGPHRLRFQ